MNIKNSSTTESELWRNAEPSAFQLKKTMLKSDKIWWAYLICVRLRTFWTPLVHHFTQSISSLRSTHPNHCNLLLLINKLTGSSPSNSLISEFFLLSFRLKPQSTHPSKHTHYISIQLRFTLHLHWPSLTIVNQTTSYTSSLHLTYSKYKHTSITATMLHAVHAIPNVPCLNWWHA